MLKEIKKVKSDAKKDRKVILELKNELAWHTAREESASGARFVPPIVELEADEDDETEEFVGDHADDGTDD